MRVFIIFVLVVFSYADYSKQFINQWKNILHIDNKKFKQDSFYLSYPYVSWRNELILNLERIKKQDKMFICSFPYRYIYLSKYFKLPKIDIFKTCPKLKEFYDSFQKEKLGIVFSSEYSMSPQSAFGHVMLIFKDTNKPLLTADVVHFAAVVKKEGFFKYSYNGLTGKFPAFYIKEKLFKKYYLYNMIQQRSMFVYWLNFDKKEIENLILHLYELKKFKANYYFLNYNCSTATIEALSAVRPSNQYNKIIILPIKSVILYKKNVKNIQTILPLDKEIVLLYKKMNFKEKKIFNEIVKMKYLGNYKTLPNITKEAIVKFYQYMFYSKKIVYPNYNEVVKLKYKKEKLDTKKIKDPLQETMPSEIFLFYNSNDNSFLFSFRPFLIDKYDLQNKLLEEKQYSVFAPTFYWKKNHFKLEKFDFMNSVSIVKNYSFIKDISWKLYLGLNRENYKRKLSFEFETGIGNTHPFFKGMFNWLLNLGFDVGHINQLYLKPEINFMYYFSNNFKIGDIFYYKIFSNTKIYYMNETFLSKEITYNLKVILSLINTTKNRKILIGLGYNF